MTDYTDENRYARWDECQNCLDEIEYQMEEGRGFEEVEERLAKLDDPDLIERLMEEEGLSEDEALEQAHAWTAKEYRAEIEKKVREEIEDEVWSSQDVQMQAWDDFCYDLGEGLDENIPDWNTDGVHVSGSGLGWQRRSGYKDIPADKLMRRQARALVDRADVQCLLWEILPDTQNSFDIWFEPGQMVISNTNHDSCGELYFIEKLRLCEYCEEHIYEEDVVVLKVNGYGDSYVHGKCRTAFEELYRDEEIDEEEVA